MALSCKRITYETIRGESNSAVMVIARDGDREVGRIAAGLEFGRPPFSTAHVVVKPDVQRCGVGTRLYEIAAQGACDMGYKLASDSYRSSMSQGFWAKQMKKGRARCISTADPVITEQQEREFPTDAEARYGRGGCDRYELVACPVGSLAGRHRRKRRR